MPLPRPLHVLIPLLVAVALDQRTVDFLKKRGTPHYLRQLRSRSGSTDNHATSGLKFQVRMPLMPLLHVVTPLHAPLCAHTSGLTFQILHELLSVGVSVLQHGRKIHGGLGGSMAEGP